MNIMNYSKKKFNIFGEKYFSDYSREMIESLRFEVNSLKEEYILNVNEDELIQSIESKYILEPISFQIDKIFFSKPTKEEYRDVRGTFVYFNFIMSIPFTGSEVVLTLMPSSRSVIDFPVYIDYDRHNNPPKIIYTDLKVLGRDEGRFNQERDNAILQIKGNLESINKEVISWNISLKQIVKDIFSLKKNEYLEDNKFFEAVKINMNSDSDSLFNANIIKKKVIPQPELNIKNKKFSISPTLDKAIYIDIITVLNSVGKSFERKPSIYLGKEEEHLRDIFLIFLETRYENATGTGETFNKEGKTDILLKYTDGTNLFISEFKIWKGEKKLLEDIDQLYKYLTWRDTKTALVIFVNNKDFSNVIDTVKKTIPKHSLYKELKEIKDETSLGYIFKFPEDSHKVVFLEVMLFHFPHIKS